MLCKKYLKILNDKSKVSESTRKCNKKPNSMQVMTHKNIKYQI